MFPEGSINMRNIFNGSSPPLYDPLDEHDSCGVGFVADISGRQSHMILDYALTSVINVTHRGAMDADAKTGDGAGILTQIPSAIFYPEANRRGYHSDSPDDLAVAVVFLPRENARKADKCRSFLEEAAKQHGLTVVGWRDVPIDPSVLGEKALATMPLIQHLLLGRPTEMSSPEFQRNLFLARKQAENSILQHRLIGSYILSMSNKTIVYKGLLLATQLKSFYLDLQDPRFHTALAVFHQRYSTNTLPSWILAQPFRYLAHNGEINTLQGNSNWMRAREPELESRVWGNRVHELAPIIQSDGSDSSSLDNALETLAISGRDLLHSMMMLIPEPWENMPNMNPEWRAFYEFHACLTEPWDGPAALAFSDGTVVGAVLDRNGLRPARYKITDNGILIMASEVGTIDLDDAHVVEKGRLGPGQMIAVDTARKQLLRNDDIKRHYSRRQAYAQWIHDNMIDLSTEVEKRVDALSPVDPVDIRLQLTHGYTNEENILIHHPMMAESKEPVGSMGDDTPLAVLSNKPRLLYTYFKQKFAQVTNPPIDPLREHLVMSLNIYLGPRASLLEEHPCSARLIRHRSPILTDIELLTLKEMKEPFRAQLLPILFPVSEGSSGLEPTIAKLCKDAEEAMDQGIAVLILSDRNIDAEKAPIPSLLAVGAVHHHLIRVGKRMKASIVLETAEAREMHQFATLIGYGASAINPYLALATIHELTNKEPDSDLSHGKAVDNYLKTVDKQILKIMSKMGISTVSAYHGAQIFEAIGLSQELVDRCFTGTPSRISGIGFEEIARDVLERHSEAFAPDNATPKLGDSGFYRFRKKGEPHAFAPQLVRVLHKALIDDNDNEGYAKYRGMVEQQDPIGLRDLLSFLPAAPPIPLDEVEPAAEIVKRFGGGSMSFGALSIEAHEALAVGFNRIGSISGSGEGGEDKRRFGTTSNSFMKQVASGRFGVTPAYLASATVLEIKMAQGSKPGEGGQLPGHKVTDMIAYVRHTQPGVPLISPPPHHDIYSIEDLAQLIYDLKVANPRARVAVKLVAEAGVGTIAAGVAKGYADVILISGHEGGTGASPFISIKNAGAPWEIGLAETQQVLVMNDLRGRVTLRVDGGIRIGRDVVVAAMLGAEEFGFGTSAMIAVGCTMARQCHLNTCPVGVATQDPELRKKFWGTSEMLIRYLFHVAEDVRVIMASIGARSLIDIIGRADLLSHHDANNGFKTGNLDLTALTTLAVTDEIRPLHRTQDRNDRTGDVILDDELLPQVMSAIEGTAPVKIEMPIRNVHRTVGARISVEIARRYGDEGLQPNSIHLRFWGSAGQSFGAFCINGLHLTLEGEANDYVGKGMHGGFIVLRPPRETGFYPHDAVIMGNTVLYGATGGHLFAAGRAGERFAVRNSGAWAVVEGAGDHCCEYMTEGVVVVLGPTGRNFGAGMSGGTAYVLDLDGQFHSKYNPEMVGIHSLEDDHDLDILHTLIERHHQLTSSPRAEDILENWMTYVPKFLKVAPLPHVAPSPPRDAQRSKRDLLKASGKANLNRG
jgi:glutamate synthase (ferredoxin)